MNFRFLAAVAAMAAFSGVSRAQDGALNGVVLVIADGTSQELLTAARLYEKGVDGRLALESLPNTAIVRTASRSSLVTDSAAAATAMGRGIKADNRVLGMESAESNSTPTSILDIARSAGWATAVVTDDAVTGATPAAFLVEFGNRDREAEVAALEVEQLGKRVDLLIGGGSRWFIERGTENDKADAEMVRGTEKALRESGAAFFDSWPAFEKFAGNGGDGRPVLGVFFPGEFPFYADGKREVRLVDLIEQTLKILRARKQPFLLVVEAALPDKACHLNNAKRAMVEVGELDATIEWLQKNLPPRTLLLVTTDHNNGGLTINGQPARRAARGDEILMANPVNHEMLLTWATGPGGEADKRNAGLAETDVNFVQPAVYPRGSGLHSGGDVWLLGSGPGSEKVHGYLDNTEIFGIMRDAIEGK